MFPPSFGLIVSSLLIRFMRTTCSFNGYQKDVFMFSGGFRLVQTLFLKGDSPSTHGLDQWVLGLFSFEDRVRIGRRP